MTARASGLRFARRPIQWILVVAATAVGSASAQDGRGTAGPGQGPDAPWRTLEGRVVDARYLGRDSLRAARGQEILEALSPPPGLVRTDMRILLTVAPTVEAMDSLASGRLPEWVGAVALPHRMEIVVPGRASGPRSIAEEVRVLRHEWAHLALAHELDGLEAPRWFDEGFAEWFAGGRLDRGGWTLGAALLKGDAPPLDSIALTWPAARRRAELAYALSASAVQYLWEASGRTGLEALFAEWKRSGSFDAALRDVYGATADQLESDWRKWIARRYGWLIALSDSALFWAVMSVALASMALVRRRRRRERLARLRADEPPDAPAYWTVDGDDDPHLDAARARGRDA